VSGALKSIKPHQAAYFLAYCGQYEYLNDQHGGLVTSQADIEGRHELVVDWHWKSNHPGGHEHLKSTITTYQQHGPRQYDETEILDELGEEIIDEMKDTDNLEMDQEDDGGEQQIFDLDDSLDGLVLSTEDGELERDDSGDNGRIDADGGGPSALTNEGGVSEVECDDEAEAEEVYPAALMLYFAKLAATRI